MWTLAPSRRALAVAVGVLLAGSVAFGVWRSESSGSAYARRALLPAVPARPYVLFVSLAPDDSFKRVSVAALDAPDKAAHLTPLSCERVYFAGNRGVCLTVQLKERTNRYFAEIFDEQFRVLQVIPLGGNPSRVRVSPDATRAAATIFESGHSYAAHGFSTRTLVFDLASARVLGDLEKDFRVSKDGQPFSAVDFNFWGVTFAADSNTFYATLATAGVDYLVRGDIDRREMQVIRAGVECPSLAPDNSRLVFKKRIGSRTSGWWQLASLDLSTLVETPLLGETRSVDDQVEWLDNQHVLYQMSGDSSGGDVWALEVARDGAARLFARGAYSPAIVRR